MVGRAPAVLVGDAVALDFLNTVVVPTGESSELLDSGESLLVWMTQVKLIKVAQADEIRASSTSDGLKRVAAEVRELREWFRTFVTIRRGQRLTFEDLLASERLNCILEKDESFSILVASGEDADSPIELRAVRRWRSADSLLVTIAETLARFLCEEDLSDVKACEAPRCRLFFADQTQGHARRWCSMAVCGNRAKQAAHRNRARGTSTSH